MKIAIAILVKNEEPRIKFLLESLKDADVDLTAFFDDGSEDNTWQTLSQVKTVSRNIDCKRIIFPESFSEKKNYIHNDLIDYDYILHIDADEQWDPYFLENIKKILSQLPVTLGYAFPRINKPHGRNYPDYQIRLLKNSNEVKWEGDVHERPFAFRHKKPLLDMYMEDAAKTNDKGEGYCFLMEKYPILHLERRTDIERPWW